MESRSFNFSNLIIKLILLVYKCSSSAGRKCYQSLCRTAQIDTGRIFNYMIYNVSGYSSSSE
ncbi:hypothetical protein KC19_12G070400 [Ceratodon purpureus]|uniref:Uncharacterized protein n=1 Tax=Ceratodon purpureus TaxID=3225 RepID=A0A8T0G6V4_CERPU|nr:hypothetical protein KC19_12G070400 [Ceratodon purpureus]